MSNAFSRPVADAPAVKKEKRESRYPKVKAAYYRSAYWWNEGKPWWVTEGANKASNGLPDKHRFATHAEAVAYKKDCMSGLENLTEEQLSRLEKMYVVGCDQVFDGGRAGDVVSKKMEDGQFW
jgi:hypothetical protein